MSGVFIGGAGAVSAAGWGMVPLRDAVARGVPIDVRSLDRPGWDHGLRARGVPPPPSRPAFLSHPRLRRSSSITHYAVAAAIEALGGSMTSTQAPIQPAEASRLGIVYCVMSGCVSYSRRFYHEVIQNPSTASPLLFPETVFNAPASHLSAYLGVTSANYTLVGDAGGVLVGLATGARWIREGRVDRCLLVGAEELDWLTVDAFRHFDRGWIFGEGAGALLLQRAPSPVELDCVTDAELFTAGRSRMAAARRVKEDLPPALRGELLCEGLSGAVRMDGPERTVWDDWKEPRVSVKQVLGDGLSAGAAWQCALGFDSILRGEHPAARISVVGCHQQAIAARMIGVSDAASNPTRSSELSQNQPA